MEKRNSSGPHPTYAYVGCFTHPVTPTHHEYAKGKGISVFSIDQQTGAWNLAQICEATPNPGYIALDRDQKFLYCGHGNDAKCSAFSIDRNTGKLTYLNSQPNGGYNAVYMMTDPTNRYVISAHGPGLIAYPMNADGSLAAFSDKMIPPNDSGRNKVVLTSHPHQVAFDPKGQFFISPDHGLDRIHVAQFDASRGKFVPSKAPSLKSRSGAAPRHIAYHPTKPYAYIVNELDCTVAAYKWDSERGELTPIQVLPRTPDTHTGNDKGSQILVSPSGKFVYASNRGHDSIVTFSIDSDTGRLTTPDWVSAQGKLPRYFEFNQDATLMYVANSGTDSVVIFNVNRETGKLTYTGQTVYTESPTCLAFAYF